MAFSKTANAIIVQPEVDFQGWDKVCGKANVPVFNRREAAKVVLQKYDPQQHLLSHCTIVASVDTENGPGELGREIVNGFQIDRKYSDYFITPETSKFVNNNYDAWSRPLLLASYPTFIGGESYVEHIQIPELSKGKIIDAAARDIGESIYIDILVANDRKHRPLIAAITNGTLNTLSMGAQVQFTICTKCGNVAYDETQLCPCIKYAKGTTFFDKNGQKRIVSELCGHVTAEPGSCRFIEASWVGNPAFTGAVLRNILTEEEIKRIGVEAKLMVAFSQPVRRADPNMYQKAASLIQSDFGTDPPAQSQQSAPSEPKTPEKGPLDKVVDDLANTVREQVSKKIQDEMAKTEVDNTRGLNENLNDTLIKSAMEFHEWREIARKVISVTKNRKVARKILVGLITYKSDGWTGLVKSGSYTGNELLSVSRMIDLLTRKTVIAGDSRLYRTVLAVGGMKSFHDIESYLVACRQVVGRDLNKDETSILIDRGRLFSLGS